MPRIAMLHTVSGLLPVFADLARSQLQGADVFNIVDESLLQNVIREDGLSIRTMRQVAVHIGSAVDAGADAILVTCSSIGPAVDAARPFCAVPLVRIDQGMAQAATEAGERIGVLATVRTTMEPTRDLIATCAAGAGKTPQIVARVCDGAFDRLLQGDTAGHDRIVAEALEQLAAETDVVVLAQASMGRVMDSIPEGRISVPVLTSPDLGIRHFRSVLAEAGL